MSAICKQCESLWFPSAWHLSVMPHEANVLVNGRRHYKTDFCENCEPDKLKSKVSMLEKQIALGECPGPLLWGKV